MQRDAKSRSLRNLDSISAVLSGPAFVPPRRLTYPSQRGLVTEPMRTPREYVFDVTSIGQRSSPWAWKLSESRDTFHLECKLYFPSAQRMLRQTHLTNVSESIEAKYWVSWQGLDVERGWIRAIKTALNSLFCAVIADSKSRWPPGKKKRISVVS